LHSRTQVNEIEREVRALVDKKNLFPTQAETGPDFNQYYRDRKLAPVDELNINQIIWDLIIGRIVNIGRDQSNKDWPWLRLTEFGENVVADSGAIYDPEGYGALLDSISPKFSSIIKQYSMEALYCYMQRLYFATAVMIGAAAEAAVLLLAQNVIASETDPKEKKKMEEILARRTLPSLFEKIRNHIQSLIDEGALPYLVHQGWTEHLLSLFEMIRVQRNDAVHPAVGSVNKEKIFLSIHTLPEALRLVYRLIQWFEQNR